MFIQFMATLFSNIKLAFKKDEIYDNALERQMIAHQILQRSQELVPVATGYLKSTAYINPYGTGYVIGYSAPYAVYVHEVEWAAHKFPTQVKFLEGAAYEIFGEQKTSTGREWDMRIQYDPLALFFDTGTTKGEPLFEQYKDWSQL